MRPTAQHETDVLIVGAGPTGLTLACELLGRGVGCRIIDRAASPATTSRALGLQPRTLELFDRMGIIDRVISTGGPVIDANLYRGDRLLLTLSAAGLRNLDTPYPRLWITPQASVESPLIERLLELGGTVERSRELEGFRQTGSGVIATVKHGDADETEEIHARWLVGCDGARSRTRKVLGVAFEGDTYEERFLLADADVDWGRERDRTPPSFPCRAARSGAYSPSWKTRLCRRSRWSSSRDSSGSAPGTSRPPSPTRPGCPVSRSTVAWWTGTASGARSWPATRPTSTAPSAPRG